MFKSCRGRLRGCSSPFADDAKRLHPSSAARGAIGGKLMTFRALAGWDPSRLSQQFAAEGELVGALVVGKKTVMADAMEPIW